MSSIGILASKTDEAALTQASLLEKLGHKIHYIDYSVLQINDKDELPKHFESWIVLSKHSSISKKPSFTTHSVGNFGSKSNNLGGNDFSLGYSNAVTQSQLLSLLFKFTQMNSESFSNFDTVAEATHHGPTINIPLTFIEMGSTEDIWKNLHVAEAVAWAVNRFLDKPSFQSSNGKTAIGFGGPHYAWKFSKLMINGDFQIGHIFPKYAWKFLSVDMIDQMINRTFPKPSFALIDKKGVKQKSILKENIQSFGLEIIEI